MECNLSDLYADYIQITDMLFCLNIYIWLLMPESEVYLIPSFIPHFDKFCILLLRLHKNREAQMDFSLEIFSAILLLHRISRNIVHCSMLFLRLQLLFAILFILFCIFDIPYAYFLQTSDIIRVNVPQYHRTYHG